MEQKAINVDWNRYARKYDMLMKYNPFYQQLRAEVLKKVGRWKIDSYDRIADIGAGTGNYSVAVAKSFPGAKVFHVDRDLGMCSVAENKKQAENLQNLEIVNTSIEDLQLEPSSLKACLCIHSLYTFPDPEGLLKRIYDWLVPGGHGIFVDPGRPVKVLDWQIAIGWRMVKKYGLRKTLEVMKEGREISYQNQQISKYQADGTYWTHTPEEFVKTIQNAGFNILESRLCFRKISDMVIVSKN